MTMICKHCGLSKDEHHQFEPKMPDGCICDPNAWFGEDVPPVCNQFVGDTDDCENCPHEKACHK